MRTGIQCLPSARSVPHFNITIGLDEPFIDALRGELAEPTQWA